MAETWRQIPGHPGYEVSDHGRVRSVDRYVETTNGQRRFYRGQMLRPGRAKSKHVTVAIGKGNSQYVHTLVLTAFVGPCPPGHECLHKDDIHDDNRLERLRWGTRSENMLEAWANGRHG